RGWGPGATRSGRPSPPRAGGRGGRRSASQADRTPACLPCRGFRPCAPHSLPASAPRRVPARDGAIADGTPGRRVSHGPGVELERAGPPRRERGGEDVLRVERLNPVDEVLLAEPVQGTHRAPAGLDLRPLPQACLYLSGPRPAP